MYTITIDQNTIQYDELQDGKKNMMELLRASHLYINAPCNGTGHCGKCAITILKGNASISDADRAHFSSKELDAGKRLACTCYPDQNLTIALDTALQENDFEIISSSSTTGSESAVSPAIASGSHSFGIAVDIGTTTIAAVLIDLSTGTQCGSSSRINHQRAYGADVISRIQAANQGKLDALHDSIVADLRACILELTASIDSSALCEIAVAGNTTMIHLLIHASCEMLGAYPFQPVHVEMIHTSACDVLGNDLPDCPLTILPGISAFVGSDIVSGIYAAGLASSREISLLVDLGTNGELAIGNNERILVSSTAAGPAFEGGNISCGTGSVRGAVSDVTFMGKQLFLKVIGTSHALPAFGARHAPAVGICGTGVISLVSALLSQGIIDSNGTFRSGFEDGYPFAVSKAELPLLFTQSDIHELLLAKAAVCAGIELLITRFGITPEALGHVYVAGGFGLKLDIKKATRIGLFPSSLADKIISVGNSCLSGLIQYLIKHDSEDVFSSLIGRSSELTLANDDAFHDLYLENISFNS